MRTIIEDLAGQAEQQLRGGVWRVTDTDRSVAAKAAAELSAAVGPADVQETLAVIDRLAHLREALAAVALALAHVHGRLAWFLGAAATALTPILHWRALPVENGPTFGAVAPTPEQYRDAEDAIRRLHTVLTRITAN
ncbi:hypothetical protein ACIQUQ_28075 [Streptomyces sp. NPDC101118]|uniref:hypothetical protein n=1 Tax=Streptomyces sp. NPDC101118 TaxID=3366109 RepID=UPI00381BD625